MQKILKSLNIIDLTVIVFYLFLITMNLMFHERVIYWKELVAIELGVILFVILSARKHLNSKSLIWKHFHLWYIAPLILFTFKQLYFMVHPIHPTDYDELLIQIDRWIFGVDPTVWIYQFANPILTELLQIVYNLFYLLPIILGIELVIKKRMREFEYAAFLVVYGFFLSYIGYFSLPAIGPRFTLHDFYAIDLELPGLLLTNALREFVNIGESIPSGTPNPELAVQRDVFPSGHTQLTLVVMILSYKLNARTRYFLIPAGTLLIIATVYLRYHYVIDLIAGFVFMLLTFWSGKYLYKWWNKYVGKEILKLN
ncbi:MAG: phosphatase PAP2 family protein [Bacteroidetes bacterium]|nr:phosphatase PAP2 family protein [Bacteroidota bacterium]MBU2583849.1 phosphatase PAP2 family protein [Bacteroidota bacterium]